METVAKEMASAGDSDACQDNAQMSRGALPRSLAGCNPVREKVVTCRGVMRATNLMDLPCQAMASVESGAAVSSESPHAS